MCNVLMWIFDLQFYKRTNIHCNAKITSCCWQQKIERHCHLYKIQLHGAHILHSLQHNAGFHVILVHSNWKPLDLENGEMGSHLRLTIFGVYCSKCAHLFTIEHFHLRNSVDVLAKQGKGQHLFGNDFQCIWKINSNNTTFSVFTILKWKCKECEHTNQTINNVHATDKWKTRAFCIWYKH